MGQEPGEASSLDQLRLWLISVRLWERHIQHKQAASVSRMRPPPPGQLQESRNIIKPRGGVGYSLAGQTCSISCSIGCFPKPDPKRRPAPGTQSPAQANRNAPVSGGHGRDKAAGADWQGGADSRDNLLLSHARPGSQLGLEKATSSASKNGCICRGRPTPPGQFQEIWNLKGTLGGCSRAGKARLISCGFGCFPVPDLVRRSVSGKHVPAQAKRKQLAGRQLRKAGT